MTFFANLTQPEATLIGLIITAVVGPVILFLLNKFFNRRADQVDIGGKLQGMWNTALDELAQEREARRKESEEWEKKYNALEAIVKEIQHQQTGPYLLTSETEFNTLPVPTILRQSHKLELIPAKTV